MSDMKKLCKRDYLYWLILALIMLGMLAYMNVNVLGNFLNVTMESVRNSIEFWSTHPGGEKLAGELNRVWIPFDIVQIMLTGILGVSFAGQAVRMLFQDTKNRSEVMNLFPVKSRNRLTYYYVSGLFTIAAPVLVQMALIRLNMLSAEKREGIIFDGFEGTNFFWSYAVKTVIIFMLHASLLILCRELTNHMVGTVFTFIIVELAMRVSADYCLGWYWDNLLVDDVWCWLFWMIMTVVFMILAYLADGKKDYARNGFYAFPVVHWIMMGVVFAEVCYIFYDTYENIPRLLSYGWAIVVSLLITAGVHFLTKPKNI